MPEARPVKANLVLLQQRSAEIRRNLALLRQAAQLSPQEFTADEQLLDASLYRLLVSLEAAQAICTHLSARLPVRAPDSAPDCFLALAEAKVIPLELGSRLCDMARFRNLLIHRYWELHLAKVHAILCDDLKDLEEYLDAIAQYVGTSL